MLTLRAVYLAYSKIHNIQTLGKRFLEKHPAGDRYKMYSDKAIYNNAKAQTNGNVDAAGIWNYSIDRNTYFWPATPLAIRVIQILSFVLLFFSFVILIIPKSNGYIFAMRGYNSIYLAISLSCIDFSLLASTCRLTFQIQK